VTTIATRTKHRTVSVDGLDIFYREAGDPAAPTLLLLHGLPTSSRMFRNLIPALADRFHLVAPDYPGFGHSSFPEPGAFEYTFANLTRIVERFIEVIGLERFSLYVQDYGAPIGLRIASRRPDRVQAIVTQSGNAYLEGFTAAAWEPLYAFWRDASPENEAEVRALLSGEGNVWQWTHGTRDPEHIDPDLPALDTLGFDRPGNRDAQISLIYDYRLNLDEYPAFQQYFRDHQPPTLVTWGRNDEIFGPDGARAYLQDLPRAEVHLLDTGHFALEEEGEFIAERIREFLGRNVEDAP
jgi:pimeloyl-ACP methyl ester carboxylesterase